MFALKQFGSLFNVLLLLLSVRVKICPGQFSQTHRPPWGGGIFSAIHNTPIYYYNDPQRLQHINGDHISMDFYFAVERADRAKEELQHILHNFLENLQRNLTTSNVLNTIVRSDIDVGKTQRQLQKLDEHSAYFEAASNLAQHFAALAETFFEASKNESAALLLKLRQVPTTKRILPMSVKMQLTNYFAEMEFFHIMLSEIADECMEYITDTLHSTQRVLLSYADVQRDVLRNWNFKPDEWCCNRYMDFLQQWSAQIYKCAAGHDLAVAYDVYAMSEVIIKYLLRQLEFRIQCLYNCFLNNNYELRCGFLRNAEQDFEKLFAKLDELQMYYDIKTKHGRVTLMRQQHRRRRRRRRRSNTNTREEEPATLQEAQTTEAHLKSLEQQYKCIPYDFPATQMLSSLKSCFYFPNSN